jgi:DNA-binding beta-propeller fold protein YncE
MSEKISIIKFDAYENKKKKLSKINTEYTSIWKRLFTDGYDYLAEVIAVNPSTNKIYVSDSKNNLLYEIDG